MPFSRSIREEILIKSGRCCCVCRKFIGRSIAVHHIVSEADGGPDTLDNAIPLCPTCHAEAGHYNDRHPLGTKYSPSELRRHRDEFLKARRACPAAFGSPMKEELAAPTCQSVEVDLIERETGVLWSRLANMPKQIEIIKFQGSVQGEYRCEDASGPHWWELLQVQSGMFLVYHKRVCNFDYCLGDLMGFMRELSLPLSLAEVQDEYPKLATAAGLSRVRTLYL